MHTESYRAPLTSLQKLYLACVLGAGAVALSVILMSSQLGAWWNNAPHDPRAIWETVDYNLVSCGDIRYRYNGQFFTAQGIPDANHERVTVGQQERAQYERKALRDHWNAKGCTGTL